MSQEVDMVNYREHTALSVPRTTTPFDLLRRCECRTPISTDDRLVVLYSARTIEGEFATQGGAYYVIIRPRPVEIDQISHIQLPIVTSADTLVPQKAQAHTSAPPGCGISIETEEDPDEVRVWRPDQPEAEAPEPQATQRCGYSAH